MTTPGVIMREAMEIHEAVQNGPISEDRLISDAHIQFRRNPDRVEAIIAETVGRAREAGMSTWPFLEQVLREHLMGEEG
jgi:hypothetical protein